MTATGIVVLVGQSNDLVGSTTGPPDSGDSPSYDGETVVRSEKQVGLDAMTIRTWSADEEASTATKTRESRAIRRRYKAEGARSLAGTRQRTHPRIETNRIRSPANWLLLSRRD